MPPKPIYHKLIKELQDKTQELFADYVKTQQLKRHCLEVSTIMKFLAQELATEEEDKYQTTGLLHDLDFEEYPDLETHGKITAQRLKPLGYHDDMIHAILSHNEKGTNVKRETKMDYCLSAADNISGLIYAYALMRGSLKDMKIKGLKKKMKDKTFAANVQRDLIYDIEKIIPLDNFLEISIKAMQSIAEEIGFKED